MSQQQRQQQQQQQLQGQKKPISSSNRNRNSGGESQQLEEDQTKVRQQQINENEEVVGNENEEQEEDDDDDPPLPVGGMKNHSAEGQIKQMAQRKGDILQQRPYLQDQQQRVIQQQQQQQQLQIPQQSSKTKQQSHGKKDLSSIPAQQQLQSRVLEGSDTIGFQGTFRQDESNFISPNLNITDVSQDNINVSQVLEDSSFTQIVQKGSNNGNNNASISRNTVNNNNFYTNENNNNNCQSGKTTKSPLAGRREQLQQQQQGQSQQQQQHLNLDSLNRGDPLGMGVQSYNSSKQSMGMGLKINNTNNSINRGSNNNININLNGNLNNLSNYRSSQQQQQALPYQMSNNSNYNSANSRQDSQNSNTNANNNLKPNVRMLNNANNVFNQNSNGSFNYGSMYGIMQSSSNQDAIMSRISRNNNNNSSNIKNSNVNSHLRSQISNSSNTNNTLEEQFLDRGNASQSQRYPTDKPNKHFAPLEMETTKQGNMMMQMTIVNNQFFYDALPYNYQSTVVSRKIAQVLDRALIQEFVVPYLVAFLLHVLLWGLQRGIEDYCFYDAANTGNMTACACSNFGSRFWTFVKQLLSWKLGVMVCKNIVLQQISEQGKKNKNKDNSDKMKMMKHKILKKARSPPILESFIMFGAGIAVDFIMVVILDMSQDWYFYVAMSIIGFIVTLHSVKLSQLSSIFSTGRGLILYDMNVAFLICFGYFALPNIYSSLVTHNGYADGRNSFLYIYPLLELAMEIVTNQVLDYALYAQFFEYQLQLFIMGLRLGVMSSVTLGKFEFWYLGVFFAIKTVISTTGVLYINVRRAIYHSVPGSLRYLVSMEEVPEHVKGKHGFLMENLLWLFMFFWWIFTGTLVPGYVKSSLIIDDCAFNADTLFKASTWDRGFFTWIFVLIGTVLSLLLNVSFRYDMIKWVGAPQHNIVENVLTRMFGWYLFQVALGIAYSFSIEKTDTYSGF